MTNSNLEKGIPWLVGPDWPGQRCGAKTRKGKPCQRPAYKRSGRCSLHGVSLVGPKTEGGLALLTVAERRRMWTELKELETWFIDRGHLDKKWRDQFK